MYEMYGIYIIYVLMLYVLIRVEVFLKKEFVYMVWGWYLCCIVVFLRNKVVLLIVFEVIDK